MKEKEKMKENSSFLMIKEFKDELQKSFIVNNPLMALPEIKQKRIAIEVFLAKKLTRVYYEDLMNDVPEGTLSKNRLVAWINDRNTEEKEDGYGVITRYKQNNHSHFENGKWRSEKLGYLLGYASELLKDPSFFGENKNAYEDFNESFKSDEWWYGATSIISLKMIEDLFKNNGLTSQWAEEIIKANFLARELISGSGRIIGRVGKKGTLKDDDREELYSLIEESYKNIFNKTKDSEYYRLEVSIYNHYLPSIEREINEARIKSVEGIQHQLDLFLV